MSHWGRGRCAVSSMRTLIRLSNWWSLIPEQKFVSFPCRAVPKRLKDKLVSYILVLALIIDEFSLDFAVIMKDLKMPIPRYWKQNTCYCHWHEFLYFMRKPALNSNMQASWISTKAICLKRLLFLQINKSSESSWLYYIIIESGARKEKNGWRYQYCK